MTKTRRYLVAGAAVLMAGLMSAPAPVEAATTSAHVRWSGYRGVGIGDTVTHAGHRLHTKVRNHCGQYKSTSTYHGELIIDSHFGSDVNRITQITLAAVAPRLHPAVGPRGIRLGSTLQAAKQAWGGRLQRHTNSEGAVYRWGHGPGQKILIFALSAVTDANGVTHQNRVWIIGLEKNKRVAIQEMNNTGGC